VTNAGDAGSLLQVSLAKLDPAVMGGNKSSLESGADDPILTPSSIAGSTFTADAFEYDAGTTVDLHLTIDAVTAGQEWIIGMAFDAPPGVIVNASTAWFGGNKPGQLERCDGRRCARGVGRRRVPRQRPDQAPQRST
jgi:hypothetical protein